MAATINNILDKLDGYLLSIERNVETSMYELKVGFKANWIFKSTDDIECDTTLETDAGSLVTISGKHDEVLIDDLIEFVHRIIDHNNKIAKKREAFERELEEEKKKIEERILQFQNEMELEEDFDVEEDAKPSKKKNAIEQIDDEEIAQRLS